MRLLNDLLNIHDGFDDEGWLKECKKHMVDTFQERIYLAFLFQQETKLTRYDQIYTSYVLWLQLNDMIAITGMFLVELKDLL